MTYKEAMVESMGLRPSVIPEETKAAMLYRLDLEIGEFTRRSPALNPWPEDGELLMQPPYDDVYVLYLNAMADYYNEEHRLYENDMELYNTRMTEARAWWGRNHDGHNWGQWRTV